MSGCRSVREKTPDLRNTPSNHLQHVRQSNGRTVVNAKANNYRPNVGLGTYPRQPSQVMESGPSPSYGEKGATFHDLWVKFESPITRTCPLRARLRVVLSLLCNENEENVTIICWKIFL